ncbi:MAG: hypothetical protein AAF573_20945, partial [Bacteroidota bacterium]
GIFLILAGFVVSFSSCLKDSCDGTNTFIRFEPIYKTVDEIRQDIQILPPRALENPGKIYYYKDHIIVNELREGLHIIDNSNPENPTNVSFVTIPGNLDMAVKGDMMYADNYIDLLTIDISDPRNPVLKERDVNVFSSLSLHQDLGHLVYYEPTEETVEIDCSDPRWGSGWFWGRGGAFFETNATVQLAGGTTTAGAANAPAGVAGSMARFAIYNDFLYTIDNSEVDVFDITDVMNPNYENSFNVSWDIETLFPYDDKMFIGSESGMFIYDLENAVNPSYLSKFEHARACDPVFVKDNYAYVTLRDGTPCEGFVNQLDVVDITSLTSPTLVKTYEMDNPHGLSIREDHLYLCDGASGLKVYNIDDVEDLTRTDWVKSMDTYDVISIPGKNIALVVGKDGLYQFDTTNPSDLKEISSININR